MLGVRFQRMNFGVDIHIQTITTKFEWRDRREMVVKAFKVEGTTQHRH